MPNPPNINLLLAQSILLQLNVCLRNLDALGADVTAAHVDTAIESFRNEAVRVLPGVKSGKLPDSAQNDMDEMIGQNFAIHAQPAPAIPSVQK